MTETHTPAQHSGCPPPLPCHPPDTAPPWKCPFHPGGQHPKAAGPREGSSLRPSPELTVGMREQLPDPGERSGPPQKAPGSEQGNPRKGPSAWGSVQQGQPGARVTTGPLATSPHWTHRPEESAPNSSSTVGPLGSWQGPSKHSMPTTSGHLLEPPEHQPCRTPQRTCGDPGPSPADKLPLSSLGKGHVTHSHRLYERTLATAPPYRARLRGPHMGKVDPHTSGRMGSCPSENWVPPRLLIPRLAPQTVGTRTLAHLVGQVMGVVTHAPPTGPAGP